MGQYHRIIQLSSKWREIQKIVASDREANDQFGFSVALSGDYAIVGAPNEDASGMNLNDAGSVYFFERPPSTSVINNHFENAIKLYPNPNQGTFSILLDKKYKNATVCVQNSLGQVVDKKTYVNTNKISQSLETPSGIYLLQVSTLTGELATFKIVKE